MTGDVHDLGQTVREAVRRGDREQALAALDAACLLLIAPWRAEVDRSLATLRDGGDLDAANGRLIPAGARLDADLERLHRELGL